MILANDTEIRVKNPADAIIVHKFSIQSLEKI